MPSARVSAGWRQNDSDTWYSLRKEARGVASRGKNFRAMGVPATHTHTHTYTDIHTYIHTQTHTHIHTQTDIYTHTHSDC